MTRMNFFKPLAFCLAAFAVLAQEPFELARIKNPATPREMAESLERDLARFVGLVMPFTNHVFTCHTATLPVPDATGTNTFGAAFLEALVPLEQYGFETWPVTVRVDDDSGETIFYNADNDPVFWVEPNETYSPDWILRLKGVENPSPWLQEVLRPSHVQAQWNFVAQKNMEAYHAARWESLWGRGVLSAPSGGQGTARPTTPELFINTYAPANDTHLFAAHWNSVAYFPLKRMDVLFSPNLHGPWWKVDEIILPNAQPASRGKAFDVPRAFLPVEPAPPGFVHEWDCEPSTNAVVSPLNLDVVYTNVFCACPYPPSNTGFFRLSIPDPNKNIPAWWRVLHGFNVWDSWEDEWDFRGDGFSNIEKYQNDFHPTAPLPGATANTVQYLYDDDDRLLFTFPGADGAATLRHLTPAGNPVVQQERTAP